MKIGPRQKLWINFLRNNPDKQGTGTLENHGLMCCLGAACRLGPSKPILLAGGNQLAYGSRDSFNYLDETTSEYFGFRGYSGIIFDVTLKGHRSLSIANDDKVSWAEIADFVDRYPESVFTESL